MFPANSNTSFAVEVCDKEFIWTQCVNFHAFLQTFSFSYVLYARRPRMFFAFLLGGFAPFKSLSSNSYNPWSQCELCTTFKHVKLHREIGQSN